MATIRRERGETRRASQAVRDLAVLVVLLLLAFSVRFHADETEPAVKPLPGGVQAADHDLAEPPVAEPALATPALSNQPLVQPVAQLIDEIHTYDTGSRVLIFKDGEVREFRLPARLSVTNPRTDCSKHAQAEVLTRS